MSKTEKGCTQKNKRQSAKRRTNSYETFSFAYQYPFLHPIPGHACIGKNAVQGNTPYGGNRFAIGLV